MPEPEKTSIPASPVTKPMKYRYEKSAGFRSVYAMGSWGRIIGNGEIVLSLFQEMPPFPLATTFQFQEGVGWLKDTKTDFPTDHQGVRQIEADIIMSLEAAKKIQANLAHFIAMAEQSILQDPRRAAAAKTKTV